MSKEKKSFTPFARCRHLNIASESLSIPDPPRRSSRKCSHSGGSDFIQTRQESTSSSTKPLPYSTQPWASPYPPLLLLTVSGIVRFTSLFASQSSLDLISQQIRFIGLFADAAVVLIIYLSLRSRTNDALQALIPASLFLTLPAISTSPLYFFHSDTFGYPILALAALTLAKRRYLTGTVLLATATVFKIHPVLALPLVMIWLIRTQGLVKTLPSLFATTTITSLGLILPLAMPGYQQSILGFNLTNQGNGTTLTIMSLLNTVLPQTLQFAPTELLTNQIWITTTAALYTIILGTVWTKARNLSLIDVVLLGLVAWLIPLTIAYWSSSPASGPFPGIVAFYGPVLTSLVIRLVGATALVLVLYSLRKNSMDVSQHRNLPALTAF